MGLNLEVEIHAYEDNEATIQMANYTARKSKVRAVQIHYHFIRGYVKMGIVQISHIGTDSPIADGLTKALNGPMFQSFATRPIEGEC